MKILSLNRLYFLLPDDFTGNFNDALREVIKYRENLPNPKAFPPTIKINNSEHKSNWQIFLDSIKEGYRLHGDMFIGEWNGEEWVSQRDKVGTDDIQ